MPTKAVNAKPANSLPTQGLVQWTGSQRVDLEIYEERKQQRDTSQGFEPVRGYVAIVWMPPMWST